MSDFQVQDSAGNVRSPARTRMECIKAASKLARKHNMAMHVVRLQVITICLPNKPELDAENGADQDAAQAEGGRDDG